ncbi:unnamed protein product [Ranitomeya imitator]|uniref:Uncharacterized protein n=1 Tax=Ranitomeya imitator TaxID=111125 RepID=A0ABN9M751_9NEOB|nr:unnamed protein product [Ranitomeya imitator]
MPVNFDGIDLHAYIVVNDGRAYTAISQVPEPASWSLTPLTAIGGLFGWLFALEKPGFQNGFSITEVVHITQVADGFDSDNYIHLRTTIKGQIPFIAESSRVQIDPYYEIYQYSGAVVTSTAHREYTVTSANNEVQRLSYRLRQNITYQDCNHSQRFPPNAQKLAVDRMFALYNKDEKVLRFAITSHIGSVQDSSQEPAQGSPCYDGTHLCDTRAQCRPSSGQNYTCVCASGYYGDGRDCTDVNECESGVANCGRNTQCLNLPGSYKCECQPGYEFSADGQNCVPSFDTLDHQLLLTMLCSIGLKDTDLSRFSSYLSDRSFTPTFLESTSDCLTAVSNIMSSLYLKLNLSKTELLVFSPSVNLPLPDIAISVCGSTITPK